MSDSTAFAFGKFIPGFDFLQQLAGADKGADKSSGLSNWVVPTLSVQELDKRIKDLKAVHFWLDQNATALKATIQALEVQKMTLATLEGMNLNLSEVAKAFTLPTGTAAAPAAAASAPVSAPAPASATTGVPLQWPFADVQADAPESAAPEGAAEAAAAVQDDGAQPAPEDTPAAHTAAKKISKRKQASSAPATGLADPVQWWGALTQQFQQIAANAMQDAARAQPPGDPTAPAEATQTAARAGKKKSGGKRKPTAKATAKATVKKTPRAAAKATTKKKAQSTKSAARKRPAAAADGTPTPAATPAKASKRAAALGWPLPPAFKLR